jgi:hypothetical protein
MEELRAIEGRLADLTAACEGLGVELEAIALCARPLAPARPGPRGGLGRDPTRSYRGHRCGR